MSLSLDWVIHCRFLPLDDFVRKWRTIKSPTYTPSPTIHVLITCLSTDKILGGDLFY